MSGSRTKYYVDSSTFPMFDPGERINNYQAAMLDYTANSPIELSEYMNQFYGGSKLRNLKGYLKWCDTKGFTETFGKIDTFFYADSVINNVKITEITKDFIDLKDNDSYQVYKTTLNFFSEDFYIKFLATQQGVSHWLYQDTSINYEIEYPTDNTIRAVFKDGRVIEGTLPSYSIDSRFLEISYSIVTTIETEVVVPPKLDALGNIIEEGYTYIKIDYEYTYGYLQYQEGTGSDALDSIIKNNIIKEEKSFYPVIPIRTNTSWFTGKQAEMINETLMYLDIYDPSKGKKDSYEQLQKMLVEGMEGGSINDIDYITLLLGVSINTTHQSDLRYLYEFFYNLHTNYKLAQGNSSTEVDTPKDLSTESEALNIFRKRTEDNFSSAGYSDSYYTKFQLISPATNFNYTYSWANSDYFETNGQFKPDAKAGTYGVLSNFFTYEYEVEKEVWVDDGPTFDHGGHWETQLVKETTPYSLTLFCYQVSQNRFRFTMFVDLNLNNLIYHGKSINTNAASAIKDASIVKQVTHDFPSDLGSNQKFTFNYVDFEGDPTNAFIIPIEKNTFYEVGIRNQLEIAYGSHFLVCNCWVKKKVKWYKTGFFKVIVGIILIIIACLTWQFGGPYWAGSVWATYTAAAACIVIAVQGLMLILEGFGVNVRKIYTQIFGDSLGNALYTWGQIISKVIIATAAVMTQNPGFYVAYGIITMQESIDAGSSFGKAVLKGIVAAGVVYLTAELTEYLEGFKVVQQFGDAINVFNAATINSAAVGANILAQSAVTTVESYIESGSLSDAFTAGLIAFGTQSLLAMGNSFIKRNDSILEEVTHNYYEEENAIPKDYSAMNMKDVILDSLISVSKNPNTYANLASLTMEERQLHKLRNLENDYQEFNQKYQSALDALNQVRAQQTSTITAEFVAIMQANLGRFYTLFPDMVGSTTPEQFLTLSVIAGSDQLKASLGTINNFVDNKLSFEGYTPYPLYYTQMDPTVTLI